MKRVSPDICKDCGAEREVRSTPVTFLDGSRGMAEVVDCPMCARAPDRWGNLDKYVDEMLESLHKARSLHKTRWPA